MADFAAERERMVREQIAGRGLTGQRLLDAFRAVPREEFVPEAMRAFAYEDGPLPIESGQTISQPYIVALMISSAGVGPGQRMLEVGAGSGYAAAVASRIAGEVIGIERHPELARLARERMERLGYANVRIVEGDGSEGLPGEAPFEAILCAASGSHVPDALRRQLSIGGKLVMPVGEPDSVQQLIRVTRRGEEDFVEEPLGPVRFVPLIGAHGWSDPEGGKG
jgi:protein-L-isoaspartate(D-aspartate) O-methyltransferase